jgi:ribonuclease HIII
MSQIGLFPPAAGHIGTDESGKGDYFGPLVIAGFYGPDDQEAVLRELGVRDSKALSDKRIREIAASLQAGYVHSVVVVGPEKYNELYEKFRNLNKLLAWGHARVIENILGTVDCAKAVTDQFGDERFVLNALMQKGKRIELVQRPRGEEDAAVAAASILARAEFVRRVQTLSREWGVDLHKGAGPPVEAAAEVFLRRHGAAALPQVAKMHFKITERVLRRL